MKEYFKFYKDKENGEVISLESDKEVNKDKYMELIPNTVDAATEKHVPVYEKVENEINVTVGSVEHPMSEEHYIMWIAQVIDHEITMVKLTSKDRPQAKFKYVKDSIIYAYCNLHGLWETIVE